MITPAYSPTATERVLPRLALDFTTASLDSRVTITRALNTATRVNSSGYVEIVNANLPRFDYDPITLACKGLLIEESRENVSAEVNNWTTYAASLTPDVAISPAGTTTGDLFAESATSDTHLLYRAPSLSATAYTFSVFYKIVGARKLALYHTNTNTGRQFDASGVQSAGLFNTPSGGYSVTSMGNGWYRASITITAVAGANEFRFWIVRASDNALNYLGDGSSGAYLWGAQVEAGAFATSYIPTTTTSLTRNADVVSMTGTNFSSWYGAGEGAFVVDFGAVNCTEASPGALLSVCDNPLASNWFLTFITPTAVVNRIRNNGADQADMVRFGVFTGGSKSAVAYKVDSFASAVGGNAALTDTSGLVPANIAQMKIGAFDPFLTYANGCIRKINYYVPRITNAETQAFSK